MSGAPAGSAFASAVSTAVPPNPLGPPADPFAGTPADHWAEGAAGIVLPAARPVGGFTTAQVEYAYETTRKLLVAANLDKKMLLDGMPTAFADLLTSRQRATFLNGLNKLGVDKQGHKLSTRTWVMSFPPGQAQLIGSVIKVHGTMHAKAVRDKNGSYELDVDLDYLFVYPIEPPHQPASWMRVVDEESGSVDFGDWAGAATTFAPWDQFDSSWRAPCAAPATGTSTPITRMTAQRSRRSPRPARPSTPTSWASPSRGCASRQRAPDDAADGASVAVDGRAGSLMRPGARGG